MEADDEALKVRERQEVKVKVQRSLQEAEAQSFQLYHPQVDRAIRKKEELHKALREHGNRPRRSPRPDSGTRSWSRMRCWTMRWQSWRLSTRACRPCRLREPGPSGAIQCQAARSVPGG